MKSFVLFSGNSTTLNDPVPCEVHKKLLTAKITGNIDDAEKAASLVERNVLEDHFDETLQGTNVSRWMGRISDEAAETVSMNDDGDRDNLMHNLQFVTYFVELCRLFPLWSAICCQFFPQSEPTASSGNVESHIKVLKQSMEDTIPCAVDVFIQDNMDMNEGLVIDASQNYIKFISKTGEMEFHGTGEDDFQTEVVPSTSGAKADTSMDSFSEISHLNEYQSKVKEIDEKNLAGDNCNADDNNSSIDDCGDVQFAQTEINCPACRDKNLPSGAHKCILCNKNVHILLGCSISIGGTEAEGYGEKRICVSCDFKRQKQQENKIKEMKNTEKWCRTSKRELKRSKYIMPAPNWNLNNHFNKNVKIGFLTNGNMSSRVFGTKNELVGLNNTCAFDALAQVREY